MDNQVKISIVTPSYNQGSYIEDTIVSVLDQGYPNLEYIVIDGGSTDSSIDVIKKYQKHFSYWVSEKDTGQSNAINKGFSRATGEIYGWLNSDDRLESGALDLVAKEFHEHPEAGVFVGHGRKADVSNNTVYYKEPGDLSFEGFCQWMDGGNFMQPSCFFRKEAWEQAGPLDESIHIALDVDLWLKMARNHKFQAIDHLLSTALVHEDAKTTAFVNRMKVDCALVIARAGGDKYVRKIMEEMADKLTECENIFDKLKKNPFARLFWPLFKKSFKRA